MVPPATLRNAAPQKLVRNRKIKWVATRNGKRDQELLDVRAKSYDITNVRRKSNWEGKGEKKDK